MRVLMFSSDSKILERGSDVCQRMIQYGTLFEELRIVLLSKKVKKGEHVLSSNVFVSSIPIRNVFMGMWILLRGVPTPKCKVDIITAQDPFELGLIALRAARKLGVPFQAQLHTDPFSPYFVGRAGIRSLLQRRWARKCLGYADCIRVVSRRIKDSLQRELPILERKIKILPVFVDIKKIETASVTIDLHKKYPQFDFIILMASRLTKEKNIPLALQVFKEIVTKYPKTGLCIVGEGPEQTVLEFSISNFQLSKNVVFEGWVDKETLVSCYKTADLFLLTSNYEGYGRTLIEAASCGCPMVTTDVGLVGDILLGGRDVLICKPGDSGCFLKNILKIMENVLLRKTLTQNGRAAVKARGMSEEEYSRYYKESLELCQK